MNKKEIIQRIKDLIEYMGLTEYSFSQITSIDKSNLSKMLSGQRTIGDSVINKIVLATKCSKEWLKTGEGLMFNISYKERKNTFAKRVVDVLQSKGIKPEKLSELNGFDITELKSILNENASNHSLDLAFAIKDLFKDINLDWLLKGEGLMFIQDDSIDKATQDVYTEDEEYRVTSEPLKEYLPTANFKLIPLINLDVVGGINNQEMDTAQYVDKYIPFVDAKDEDVACPVTNNSMSPVYPPGTLVQIRKILRWKEYIEFGQVYVVDLVDGRRLIKQVKKGSSKNNFILSSFNTDYDDNEIPTSMIYSMWLVIAKYEKVVM